MTINLMHPRPLNDIAAPVANRSSARANSAPARANRAPVRNRAKATAVLPPTWFEMPELAEAMNHMRSRTAAPAPLPPKELALRTRNVQKHEIGFISNDNFTSKNAATKVFSDKLGLTPPKAHIDATNEPRASQNLSDHLSRLCEAPLLNQVQEKLLFQRMNFLRHQAAMQRALLNDESLFASRLHLIDQLVALADWHRDRIVEANTRLVFSVVKKFINEHNRFDDLLSDGVVALMHAIDKFDFDRGFRFSTYATTVLRRNAYREVLENQQRRLKTATGLHEMKIDVVDETNDQWITENRWQRLRGQLGDMLSSLDRREKFIIRARFSLGSHRKVSTLQALANRLGVSKERVRQLEHRGLEKLQTMAVKMEVS